MGLFWIDESRNIKKTYDQFINDLNNKGTIRKYICIDNPYEIILELIYSLTIGYSIELIDSDFSITELSNLGIPIQEKNREEKAENLNINDFNQLISIINNKSKEWRLTLYTSGTTGKPKKVTHGLSSIIRTVKRGKKFKNNIWAFAYNPTHFAGLQVLFQAFLNENPMIYVFDSDKDKINDLFIKYQITNISATPTFFRVVLPYIKTEVNSIKRITLGGEKFDKTLKQSFSTVFPNAQVRNIYASTEAGSLFTASGENFTIRDNLEPYVKISNDGELLIHKKLLGKSKDFKLNNGWYNTGDIVEIIQENKIRFISRRTEMINIGGYKVNPYEVEEEIKEIQGVVDVLVKARSNKFTGNILVAEVVKSFKNTEKEIEDRILMNLTEKFQKWKIPRIIKFVDKIEKTRTGKKVRK